VFPPSAGSARDGQLLRISDGEYPGFLGFVKEIRQDAGNATAHRFRLIVPPFGAPGKHETQGWRASGCKTARDYRLDIRIGSAQSG